MAFDNLKLEKGLYTSGKSFTQTLENIDPSENYIGTEYEGLDAYQRQLKRFDIKVSGAYSDSVSKFFNTTDSAVLFPEYISRSVRQGMSETNDLDKIVSTTTNIDSLDYRSIETINEAIDLEAYDVAEGAHIPEVTIKTKDKLTKLHKRGRMLVASYEAIKFQKLDLFTITLKQIGNSIAKSQMQDAIYELIQVASVNGAIDTTKPFNYSTLVDLWTAMRPYELSTIIMGNDYLAQLLKMPEFHDAIAGLNFHGSGKMITPLGAEVVTNSEFDGLNMLIGLDKNYALEKIQAGDVTTDFDKLIDRQLERATITAIAGFSCICKDSTRLMNLQ